jgi:hypothetical protein
MTKGRCETCRNVLVPGDEHSCLPRFEVFDEDDYPEYGRVVFARDGRAAAEEWGEWYDEGNGTLTEGNEVVTVCVIDSDGGMTQWNVAGYVERSYEARQITEGES